VKFPRNATTEINANSDHGLAVVSLALIDMSLEITDLILKRALSFADRFRAGCCNWNLRSQIKNAERTGVLSSDIGLGFLGFIAGKLAVVVASDGLRLRSSWATLIARTQSKIPRRKSEACFHPVQR
jgi:hypothetical protein